MNREIKFRGKEIHTGLFITGSYVHHLDISKEDSPEVHAIITLRGDWRHVDPDTVGQYIGLKDKNSKEIYEDDVVILHRGHPHWMAMNWQVVFHQGAFCLFNKEANETYSPTSLILFADGCEKNGLGREISQYIEITGNIYKDSHLLQPA